MNIFSFLNHLSPETVETILTYAISSGLILIITILVILCIKVQKDINKINKTLRYLLKNIVKNTTVIKKIK
jgi:hypothetical protein